MSLKIEGDTDAVRSTISAASLLDYESDSDNEESLSESVSSDAMNMMQRQKL